MYHFDQKFNLLVINFVCFQFVIKKLKLILLENKIISIYKSLSNPFLKPGRLHYMFPELFLTYSNLI